MGRPPVSFQDWLSAGKNDGKAHCTVCDKELAVGKSELIGHTKTASHVKFAKEVHSNQLMTSFVESYDDARIKAELNVVAMVARKNFSFNVLTLPSFVTMNSDLEPPAMDTGFRADRTSE